MEVSLMENVISAERMTLHDLRSLLEDRGGPRNRIRTEGLYRGFDRKQSTRRHRRLSPKSTDSVNVQNNPIAKVLVSDQNISSPGREIVSPLGTSVDERRMEEVKEAEKERHNADRLSADNKSDSFIVKCNKLGILINSKCLRLRLKTMVFVVFCVILSWAKVDAKSPEPRYETAYACEGKTLKIGCPEGSLINLIRANYGRFSITICNDHGNTDWSVNCMSTRSLRVLHNKCSVQQNCSILASTNMFGDPCPNTLKYLEAHYQCVPASTASTTSRPSPPWLVTSQPTVWRSTPPAPKAPAQHHAERKKPSVITPPTFRPHITLPPELKPGDIGTKKTTTKQPESSSEKEVIKAPIEVPVETKPKIEDNEAKITEDGARPRNDKPKEEEVSEEPPRWVGREDEPSVPAKMPPTRHDRPAYPEDDFRRYSGSGSVTSSIPSGAEGRSYCPPAAARDLHWNWTLAGTYSVQPCPGGATGLARWRCNTPPAPHVEEDRASRRRESTGGLQSAENFRDLGLDQGLTTTGDRQSALLRRMGGEALLKGSEGEAPELLTDYRSNIDLLPDAHASTSITGSDFYSDATPKWHGSSPDLSECRSVWLNSLEARVREGESLLSISNDLAQVTSSKKLYGGDLMTTTNIMKKLAQRMSQNVQTFPDARQREAIVTDMLLGVIKTGSNLLEEAKRPSWADLGLEAQQRAATALLTQLEENAFLLADAVAREKTILQIVKNICLSVRVLEVKNVGDETFPSPIAQEQWKASEDTITIPKAALLENRENELVRIVFVAFDRLEEILQPVYRDVPTGSPAPEPTAINTGAHKPNATKVLNSKVISASLGKGRHIQLSQMVKITMKHLRTENVTNPTCVFWDYTVNVWSAEGCEVEWWNATHTGCACAHLTNFAVLMDVHGTRAPPAHELALRLLTLVGCAVSSVALLAAVVVFHCFRNMKSDRVTIHKNLCACLLVAELIFMAGIDQTQSRVLCAVIAGLLHYFFLAAFAWMFLEGFHLYAMLVEVFEPERPRARWYCACAYCAPAVVVLASAAAYPQGYGTRAHCWLSTDRMFVMSFVGPVALVLMANWICLSMVIYMMCHHSNVSIKAKENSKLYKIRVWLNSSLVLAFLLGLTWTFGLLYLNEQTVGVAYAFTILNSLQGLFIFVFHCLQNEIFQKECARLGRRHAWLACCAQLAGPAAPPTGSSSNERQPSVKSRRYQQGASADLSDDVVDPRDVTSYKVQQEPARWSIKPSAPIYVASEEPRRTPTPQNIPHSASHAHSIASMHSQLSYRNNLDPRNNLDSLNPIDYQNLNVTTRSRSPSCFSHKMAADWGVMANPIGGGSNNWKNTSSKHHPGNTATLPHHDTLSRQLHQQNLHSPYSDCDQPLAPTSPRHVPKDEDSPIHHQGYQTTRSYNHDFRNPHVYMAQHAQGSQEMIFRKHRDRKHHHLHGNPNINHTYSEIASQQGRIYRRGSEQEFRMQDDPVYEEIERNETLMSDMSDDNSGPDLRQGDLAAMGHHGSTGSKFYGDHRPLISYSPGERHHHEQMEQYGKYPGNKWESLDRNYDRHGYDGRLMGHGYHPPQESNMRSLAAVLNGENNVVCHLEPHGNTYDVYQPQTGNSRTVSQPSF